MFKMNRKEKLQEAQNKSKKAIVIFQDTLNQLTIANEMLNEVIEEEKIEINEKVNKIHSAEKDIIMNQHIINNIKSFIPIQ